MADSSSAKDSVFVMDDDVWSLDMKDTKDEIVCTADRALRMRSFDSPLSVSFGSTGSKDNGPMYGHVVQS
jgi:hypothetical protein